MNGNIKALSDHISRHDDSIELFFLSLPNYLEIYEEYQEIPKLNILSFKDMIKVARSDMIITNHGVFTLVLFAKFTSIKFVETYHGILLFKYLSAKHAQYLNQYKEIWVSSPYMKKIYTEKFKVQNTNIVATGYPRVDRLVSRDYKNIKAKYGIPADKKIIMIAPTWQVGDVNQANLPFDMKEAAFIRRLCMLARETGSVVIFRAHMSGRSINNSEGRKLIKIMPSNKYPDTEELLSIVDILVTDWSSIALDFLVVDRPIIFLDTKSTTSKDAGKIQRVNSTGRFGDVISDWKKFEILINRYLKTPSKYTATYNKDIERVKLMAYGDTVDGKATERCYIRLKELLK